MNLSYIPRLVCLCLASFFFINLLLDLAVCVMTGAAARLAERFGSHNGARFLFALRLAPSASAVCIVAFLFVPSYLRMEPNATDEKVGWVCLIAAVLCAVACIIALTRTVSALIRTRRYFRRCQIGAFLTQIPGERLPVWVTVGRQPLIALAGILRPRLILSRLVIETLSSEELASALRHERGHVAARDNLKRLLLYLMPSAFPFPRSLEAAWARLAEWSADDHAARGSERNSLSLASALLRVARIDVPPQAPPNLLTAMLRGQEDLAIRVDRLLQAPSPDPKRSPYVTAGGLLVVALAVSAMLHPNTQFLAHELLEHLVR